MARVKAFAPPSRTSPGETDVLAVQRPTFRPLVLAGRPGPPQAAVSRMGLVRVVADFGRGGLRVVADFGPDGTGALSGFSVGVAGRDLEGAGGGRSGRGDYGMGAAGLCSRTLAGRKPGFEPGTG